MKVKIIFSTICMIFLVISCTSNGIEEANNDTKTTSKDPGLPAMPPEWETVLEKSTLPVLQTNLGGSPDLEWRYANAVLGGEVWIEGSLGPVPNDILKTIPITETGWPKQLPADLRVTLSTYYSHKKDTKPGELRSKGSEAVTGLYVITWKGKTLPAADGKSQFSILDIQNDSDPVYGTQFCVAGENRVIAKVRDSKRGVNVSYRLPDPADPIRDIKIWTPNDHGMGLNVDISTYNPVTLGPGTLSLYCTEPAPGEIEPIWHPKYIAHLTDDPSGVIRFMGYLNINGLPADEPPLEWADSMPSIYTVTNLVGIDPENYFRYPVSSFRGRCRIPYEWILDLCNVVKKDAWLQVPHVATKGHIEGLATLTASKLNQSHRVWFEFSNELWNTFSPYLPQYNAAKKHGESFGKSQGWGSGNLQAQAVRYFENAWYKNGGSDDRLINVIAGFAISTGYNTEVLEGVGALSSTLAEVFAITTYFGSELTNKLYNLPYGDGNPDESVYLEAKESLRGSIYSDYEAWQANANLCHTYKVGMVAYEGGSHVLASGYGDWDNPSHAAFMNFLENLHKHPVMRDLYLEHWALWSTAGGRTASLFVDIGGYGFYGYWGAKEDVTENPDESPRWKAAQDFESLQKGVRAFDEPLGTKPNLQDTRLFRGEVNLPFETTITALEGDGELKYAVIGGSLPEETKSSSTNSGISITGTPGKLEVARFIIRVTDQEGDPDYGVFRVNIDPSGTTTGRLLLFDPQTLPAASLEKSQNDQGYTTRFDVNRAKITDTSGTEPRIYVPFNADEPSFKEHYIDSSVTVLPTSPFAPSIGCSLTFLTGEFNESNTVTWDNSHNAPVLWVGLRNKAFSGWLGSSLDLSDTNRFGVPTVFDMLLIWRRDQMEASPEKVVSFGSGSGESSLIMESDGIYADVILMRYVIRTKDSGGVTHYYLSEKKWTDASPGRFELTDFNNSSNTGKRWAVFTPAPDSFAMPDEKLLDFKAVDFIQIDGVGVAMKVYRSGWHYGMGISRFLVVGKK